MYLPLRSKPSGIFLGNPLGSIRIEAFLDIQCPHSLLAWPVLLKLLELHGEDISLTLQLINLSDHRQSFDISKGIHSVCHEQPDRYVGLIDYFYQRQEQYNANAFHEKTHKDLINLICDFAEAFCDYPRDVLKEQMDSVDVYHMARTPDRQAALMGVWGTPSFYVNNARLSDIDSHSSVEEWSMMIKKLLEIA